MAEKVIANDTAYGQADFYTVSAQLNSGYSLNEATVSILAKRATLRYAGYMLVKRSFDILAGGFGCLALLPAIAFVKIGNMLTGDFKPMFLKQARIGRDGGVFKLIKFRSMVMLDDGRQADALLDELFEKNPELRKEYEKNHKLDNDPRITKMGKFIRTTSLDELPQFINILKGDMSLIGPRPLVEGELDAHNGNHELYESVRPGISGWWAANGRSCTDYEERLDLEYYYCRNCSIVLDIKCIFRTIKAVICRTGAK